MDTSADRVRARLAGAEEVLERRQPGSYPPRNPPFPPRGGPRQGFQQGNHRPQRDLRDVTCYTCNRKGHLSRNCPQHNWNRQPNRRPPPSNSRSVETDYYDEPTQPVERVARANTTPQDHANQWLAKLAEEGDNVKDLVLKDLYNRKGFQDA